MTPDELALPKESGDEGVGRRTAAQMEIMNAIAFYEDRGSDWLSVVTFLGIKHLFGGWHELTRGLTSGMRIYRKKEAQ